MAAWLAQQRTAGEIYWTSPLGFQYLDTAERTYAFDDPAPDGPPRE